MNIKLPNKIYIKDLLEHNGYKMIGESNQFEKWITKHNRIHCFIRVDNKFINIHIDEFTRKSDYKRHLTIEKNSLLGDERKRLKRYFEMFTRSEDKRWQYLLEVIFKKYSKLANKTF